MPLPIVTIAVAQSGRQLFGGTLLPDVNAFANAEEFKENLIKIELAMNHTGEFRTHLTPVDIGSQLAEPTTGITHYYVYTYKDKRYLFDRTMNRAGAIARVQELRDKGVEATYTINHVIQGAFY